MSKITSKSKDRLVILRMNIQIQMDKILNFMKKYVNIIFGAVIFILIITHGLFNSRFLVDNTTIFLLLILLILPYVSKIIYFKYKDFEVNLEEREQGSSSPILPQSQTIQKSENLSDKDFLPIEKQIISTLYKYQNQSFPNDFTKRWTFVITPRYKYYPEYLIGISKLLEKGFIAVIPENYHCMLTNEGLDYVNKHKGIYDEKVVFTF